MRGFVNPESENALLIYPFRVCHIKRLRGVGLGDEFRKQPAKLFCMCQNNSLYDEGVGM